MGRLFLTGLVQFAVIRSGGRRPLIFRTTRYLTWPILRSDTGGPVLVIFLQYYTPESLLYRF